MVLMVAFHNRSTSTVFRCIPPTHVLRMHAPCLRQAMPLEVVTTQERFSHGMRLNCLKRAPRFETCSTPRPAPYQSFWTALVAPCFPQVMF